MVNDYLIGLSPLARGTRGPGLDDQRPDRFIPAGAGNTQKSPRIMSSPAVYPRWRGEHTPEQRAEHDAGGLSPLARGTLVLLSGYLMGAQFIPAGAGNTGRGLARIPGEPVYPRWRGEHTKRISLFINYFLSAPHSTNIIATI